jgi:hypothetical protein
MLIPSRGPNVACGKCRACGKDYHRNYNVIFTPTDAEETQIFLEIFSLTRPYCGDKCVPPRIVYKVKAICGEANDRKERFKTGRKRDNLCIT